MTVRPSTATPRRPLRSRIWRFVLVTLLAVALLLGLGFLWLAAMFSGGFDDLFAQDPPRQGAPEVAAARRTAEPAADAAADRLAGLTLSTVGDSERLGRGRAVPECQQGQHGWKRDDSFDLRCDLFRSELMAVPGRESFRADMTALDVKLRQEGWSPMFDEMDQVLSEYQNGPVGYEDYSMKDLSSAQYYRHVDGRSERLEISWIETTSYEGSVTIVPYPTELSTPDGVPTTDTQLRAGIPGDGYVVSLIMTVEYFEA